MATHTYTEKARKQDLETLGQLNKKIEKLTKTHLPESTRFRDYTGRKGLENHINHRAIVLQRLQQTEVLHDRNSRRAAKK